MTVLLETPLPAILTGIVILAILGVVLIHTGRGIVLAAMGGVVLLVLALVGLEWLVETERERVEATIYAGCAALEANDLEAVLACLTPQATTTERTVRWAMARGEIVSVKVTHLEIGSINELTSPPSVKVKLNARIEFRDRQGEFPYHHYPAELELTLRRYNDHWLVAGHDWKEDPRGQR
ncbi:MAG: hypothetical protein U1E05_07400 [Patescibacteria group bacterium]|nr:hypothetical protein [Patescibacteria group bacterium]